MTKLSIRDKCILLTLLLALISYGGYNYLWTPVNTNISKLKAQETELKGKIGDQTLLDNQINELEVKNKGLIKNIEEFKQKQGGVSLNKEDFLVFLGEKCNENNAELIKFNDLGTKQNDGNVWKVQMDFELRGSMEGLNKICESIDSIGVKYSVGGMSLRKNENFSYLSRFFDNISKLEWYKDETPKEEPEIPTEEPLPEVAPIIPEISPPQLIPQEPQQIPATPKPTPQAPNNESITDRLDKLLELSTSFGNYGAMLLTDDVGDRMRLNITIQFTVYKDPKDITSSFRKVKV